MLPAGQFETRDLFIRAPPVTFPRVDGKVKKIELPEDVYVQKFFKKHPDSLYHDAIK
jgi:small subunit ribosomal protein S23